MNKKLYILPLLGALFLSSNCFSWPWWQSRIYLSPEDARSAEGCAQDALDHFLKPGLQNSALKRDIENFTARKKREIRQAIEDAAQHDPYITHRIKDEATARAKEASKQYMAQKIEEFAIKHLDKFGFSPDKPEFGSLLYKTEATLLAELARLNANRESFAYLLQNLESKVAASAEKEVKQLPVYQAHYDRPSAPAPKVYNENDIREIYPDRDYEFELVHDLIQAAKNNPSNKGMDRGACCFHCNQEFTTIKHRVNLPCGHAKICGTCYQTKQKCPVCPYALRISVQYLKNEIAKIRK